ncbi:hypothetical protein POX_b02385 [Penicillium oxalicum]|uniref:hypothetical protein n=1 Tax=Penicillium oxalicum TaxID=69781 RepID=UPI0020B721C2|nr:hypothetical protein POX_b02385 [Penicillium oxalicum]KAI2792348.1 hypothetical protein POX_b02385 [Penicillium oxalicum]
MLNPVPSNDPNEPLNWSTLRKSVNFVIVLGMTAVVFTEVSVQAIFWQQMVVDLSVSYTQLNQAMSVLYVGLSVGCVIFIPLAKKFGRRPVYILSTALMLASSFWAARLNTLAELYAVNLLLGLSGATNETIAEMTISDLYFVHHRASMNGLYMTMVMIGSFLAPIGAGLQATRQDWRWSYQTLGIFNAFFLILFLFIYEETKFVRVLNGQESVTQAVETTVDSANADGKPLAAVESVTKIPLPVEPSNLHHQLDLNIPTRPWRTRLALWTYTSEPIWPYVYRPFYVLFTFPTVLFTGIQYASGVVWLTVVANVIALVFPLPPYNFTPGQVGLMSLGPFVGNLIGSLYGGLIGDWSILRFARKNRGYYEPEMRLYILHLPAVCMAGGLIMFGITLDRGMHWIFPSVGGALFAFGLGSIGDAALTLVIDSYREITGDAFTGIAFLRNVTSIGIPFAITPWMQTQGLQKMFIASGFLCLAISVLIFPMIFYGKLSRRAMAPRYYRLVEQQTVLHCH